MDVNSQINGNSEVYLVALHDFTDLHEWCSASFEFFTLQIAGIFVLYWFPPATLHDGPA